MGDVLNAQDTPGAVLVTVKKPAVQTIVLVLRNSLRMVPAETATKNRKLAAKELMA
jgi:hypothetical protein